MSGTNEESASSAVSNTAAESTAQPMEVDHQGNTNTNDGDVQMKTENILEEFEQTVTDKQKAEAEAEKEDDKSKAQNITDDGGVTKRILKEGRGWETPRKGAEVIVHYVGRLASDGTVFDSSRERNEPFKFKLGKGQVIKGWDKGVKEMKKGELAVLTIKPEYGYGAAGSPPKIPPNATLEFEVELLNWIEEEDVSEKKDGSVMKKTLDDGGEERSWEKPREGAVVDVHILGKVLETGEVFEDSRASNNGEPVKLSLADVNMIEGLELAMQSMTRKEKAQVTIKPSAAYGEEGCPEKKIPPNATLVYEIEMIDFTKHKWDLDFNSKMELATQRKQEGNEFYKRKCFSRAIKRYNAALDYFSSEYNLSDEEKRKAKEFKLPCHLNLAACHLQTKQLKKVIEHCNKALEIDPNNVKGLLRRGHAHLLNDDYDYASRDLTKAKELYPDDKDVEREVALLRRKVAIQNQKDRKKFANLFEKLRKEEESSAQQQPQQPASTPSEDQSTSSPAQAPETAANATAPATVETC